MINLKDLVENNNWNLIPTTTGVYTIHNKITDTVYIGSASNKKGGFKTRFRKHIKELINNIHHNQYLQNAFNKYGAEIFNFNIVELCTPENCIQYEQSWLDLKFSNNCYNIAPFAGNCLGVKRSREQINNKCTKFYYLDKNNNQTIIGNLREFCRNNNLDSGDCYAVAQYKKAQVKGYVFRYLNKEQDSYYKSLNNSPIGKFPKLAKILHPDNKETIVKDRELELFEREIIGNNSGILAGICSGKSKAKSYYEYEGYYCDSNGVILPEVALNKIKQDSNIYKNLCNKTLNQPFIKFENLNTGQIIYSKQYKTTCNLLDLRDSSVCDCIAGRINSTKGWKITKIYE